VECLAQDTTCQLASSCHLTGIINGALQSFMQHLDRYTLADLMAPPLAPAGDKVLPLNFHKHASLATP
jgi:Rrf2 family nitric oxide-sensitive transcriptional repressor